MDAHLSADRTSLTITSPPNNRVYPPGPGTLLYISCHRSPIILPAYVFLTVDDITSEGVQVMVGTGASPPVADQGTSIQNM